MVYITERKSAPNLDQVLHADMQFHLGDLNAYEFHRVREICETAPRMPDSHFLCLSIRERRFVAGEAYKPFFEVTDSGLTMTQNCNNGHMWRCIYTINRDFSLLDPDVDYCYNMFDSRSINYAGYFQTERPIPVMQFHRRRGLPAIIVPLDGYHDHPSKLIPKLTDPQSLREKAAKICWRGAMAGIVPKRNGQKIHTHNVAADPSLTYEEKVEALMHSLRVKLCAQYADNDIFDVGLVGVEHYVPQLPFLAPLERKRATPEQHLGCRYLLALDGYDYPSSWYWMLNTNSVVFRQESDWETYGDNYFAPWIHFVPIAHDGADILEKFAWCENHLEEAAQISRNARAAWNVFFDSTFQHVRRRNFFGLFNKWATSPPPRRRQSVIDGIDQAVSNHLAGPGPFKLEIGAGHNGKPGWLATDLHPRFNPGGNQTVFLDAAKEFPIPSNSFDFVYAEHLIEQLSFPDGRNMLAECYRLLKPGGVLRIVTPSLDFLLRAMSADAAVTETRYRDWAVGANVPDARAVTAALFFNVISQQWDRGFLYDVETLRLALHTAGFLQIDACDPGASVHLPFRNLEILHRQPPGVPEVESIVLEATREAKPADTSPPGQNLGRGRPARQSSVSPWSREKTPEKDAARLTGGHFTGSYNCHTALEERPWWCVDLERRCQLRQIRIYNRVGDRSVMARANRFEIHLSDDDINWRTVFFKNDDTLFVGGEETPFIWVPHRPMFARFVRIQLPGKQFLHLEQVEIYGEEATGVGGTENK